MHANKCWMHQQRQRFNLLFKPTVFSLYFDTGMPQRMSIFPKCGLVELLSDPCSNQWGINGMYSPSCWSTTPSSRLESLPQGGPWLSKLFGLWPFHEWSSGTEFRKSMLAYQSEKCSLSMGTRCSKNRERLHTLLLHQALSPRLESICHVLVVPPYPVWQG